MVYSHLTVRVLYWLKHLRSKTFSNQSNESVVNKDRTSLFENVITHTASQTLYDIAKLIQEGYYTDPSNISSISNHDRQKNIRVLAEEIKLQRELIANCIFSHQSSKSFADWLDESLQNLCVDLNVKSFPEVIENYRSLRKLCAYAYTIESWQSPASTMDPFHEVYHRLHVPIDNLVRIIEGRHPRSITHKGQSFLFSNFMSGFNTFLMLFESYYDSQDKWLVDNQIFIDCRRALEYAPLSIKNRLCWVNPRDCKELEEALAKYKPAVCIFDAAPNVPELPLLDLEETLKILAKYPSPGHRIVMIDHSLLGSSFEPTTIVSDHHHKNDVYVFGRSLQKFDQGYLDLASGGLFRILNISSQENFIIDFTRRLTDLRGIHGSSLVENSALLLEIPDQERDRLRYNRCFRNGWLLTDNLKLRLSHNNFVKSITFAGTPGHMAYGWLIKGFDSIPPLIFVEFKSFFCKSIRS